MNAAMRKLWENLIKVLNDSPAPIEAKRLIVKDILAAVEVKAAEVIAAETAEENKEAN